jgi:hypothetical protein
MPDKQTELKIGDDDLNFDDVFAVFDEADPENKPANSISKEPNERRTLTKEELAKLLDW